MTVAPGVCIYVHCNPIINFDAWGLETQSESRDAANEAFDNGDIKYDPDAYNNFDAWWEKNEYKWYNDRAEQGYNIYSDDYRKQLRTAISDAQKDLFSSSASTATKEKLEMLAHEGVITPEYTDKLKKFTDKYVRDNRACEGSLNLSDEDITDNQHSFLWKHWHGVKDKYEVYVHGTDIVGMDMSDVYMLMKVNGYADGQTIILMSCRGGTMEVCKAKASDLRTQAKAGLWAAGGYATWGEFMSQQTYISGGGYPWYFYPAEGGDAINMKTKRLYQN